MSMNRTRKTALYGLFIALAFVLGYIESLLPIYLGAPGVKLGLANLVTVTVLYSLGAGPAAAVNLVRILLTGFTFGNMSSVLFSMGGAALSLLVMTLCRRFNLFGIVGVSILGGVFHNVGQFLVAAFVVKTFGVFSYLPVLLAAGCGAGAAIGLLGGIITERIRGLWAEGYRVFENACPSSARSIPRHIFIYYFEENCIVIWPARGYNEGEQKWKRRGYNYDL